ncbi:MAG: insulinase family protein [Cytophagales bacterium]|nr:MAG: insulinase family protein [Cytophagales bacterium]
MTIHPIFEAHDKECQIYQLSNGIRIVHKQVLHTKIAHCGFVLDVGSRDELPLQQGLAHFWEHMAFKGTNKRKAFHIINRLETVGGELNAYTTKEKICFYASVLTPHFEKAVELLKDITFDSIFPENQIERERNVILEEMAMYQDSPDDALQDEFDAQIFQNHSLGNNILGTTESVESFDRQHFHQFIQENVDTHRIVFASLSQLPFEQVIKKVEKYLAPIPEKRSHKKRITFESYQPQIVEKGYHTKQAYCAIGRTAYSLYDEKRLAFVLLINILGGPGMNSRLNLQLREKHGWVYAVEASYTPFVDTGLLAIYFNTERKHLNKSLNAVMKEMQLLQEQPLGTTQLHQAKEQLMGQLAMAEENHLNFMLMMAKSVLDLGRVTALEAIFEEIKLLEQDKIQQVAQEIFDPAQMSKLIYLPE